MSFKKKVLASKKKSVKGHSVPVKIVSSDSKIDYKYFDLAHFVSTKDISVPKGLVEQVIGQDKSVEIIRKAAAQKRNVLLVGLPGTGKSLLAQAMSEILPVGQLQDILIYPNQEDSNNPKVKVVKAGEGKKILEGARFESQKTEDSMRLVSMLLPIGWMILATILWQLKWYPDVVFAALIIVGAFLFIGVALGNQMRTKEGVVIPKLLINNLGKKVAPFFEATGARAGALLGDVRHDPLQSFVEAEFVVMRKGVEKKISFEKLWNKIAKKYPELVEKHEKGYEAIVLPKGEQIYTVGVNEKKQIVKTRIYSMNRHPYDGDVVEISSQNKKLTVTPEHKIITKQGTEKAEKLSGKESLFRLSSVSA
jgi:Lon-like ATP-dependent protease